MHWWNEWRLRSADLNVRLDAANQFYQHPTRGALPALVRALLDPVQGVKDEVKRALDACDPNWRTSPAAAREVPRLMAMVQNAATFEERQPPLQALVDIADRRSSDLLFSVLRTDNKASFDAMSGLMKMRDPRAFAEAADGLRSELKLTRNHHAENLVEIDDSKAVPILIEALPGTGDGVIKALGHFADPRAAAALVDYYRQESDNKQRTPDDLGRDMERVAAALQRILERAANDIPATALKPMLNFQDKDYAEIHIDWTPVRKLARDELKRRGIV